MKRKLLSLTLVLALVLSMVPMGVFAAASTVTSAAADLQANTLTTYTLGFDNTGAGRTVIPQNGALKVTFPSGYDLSRVDSTDVVFTTANGLTKGDVTVDNTAKTVTIKSTTAQTGLGPVAFTIADVRNPITTGNAVITVTSYDAAATPAALDTGDAGALVIASTKNRDTTQIAVDKTSVTADNDQTAEFTVTVYNKSFAPVAAGQTISVQSSRGSTDSFIAGTGYAFTDVVGGNSEDAKTIATIDATGKIVFKVRSNATGTAKIGVALVADTATENNLKRYLNNAIQQGNNDSVTLGVVGTKDITFVADSASGVYYVSGLTGSPKANGLDNYEVTFQVRTSAGVPVSGQTVTFTANNSAVTFNADSKVSDATGNVKVKVYATKIGTYSVDAKVGTNVTTKTGFAFGATGAYGIEAVTSNNAKVAKDTTKTFALKITDQMASKIDVTTLNTVSNGDPATADLNSSTDTVTATVEKQPSGASINLYPQVHDAVIKDGDFRIKTSELKIEGEYVIRIALENGKKVDYTFTVIKQGDIKSLKFGYTGYTLPYVVGTAKTIGVDTLKHVDAAGVEKSASASTFEFTSSDNTLAKVDTAGTVTMVTTNKEDVGKKFTIIATDKTNKLSASVEFTVTGTMSTIKADSPAAQAGKDVDVTINAVDNKGTVVTGFDKSGSAAVSFYVLEKPEGSIVSIKEASTFLGDLNESGAAKVTISSTKEGTVKVQAIVKDGAAVSYSTVIELKVGAAAATASAKNVVLTIGSMTGFNNNMPVKSDLAPFIQDGRTFVPVSFIAAQLGGTAEFTKNAAGLVDTVTVKVGTTTVTMTIGSTTIKVVKEGKESTVTTDVAPFIKSGRTVLPFRAVAEAFGAKVSFGPETGAVEWVKFEM